METDYGRYKEQRPEDLMPGQNKRPQGACSMSGSTLSMRTHNYSDKALTDDGRQKTRPKRPYQHPLELLRAHVGDGEEPQMNGWRLLNVRVQSTWTSQYGVEELSPDSQAGQIACSALLL